MGYAGRQAPGELRMPRIAQRKMPMAPYPTGGSHPAALSSCSRVHRAARGGRPGRRTGWHVRTLTRICRRSGLGRQRLTAVVSLHGSPIGVAGGAAAGLLAPLFLVPAVTWPTRALWPTSDPSTDADHLVDRPDGSVLAAVTLVPSIADIAPIAEERSIRGLVQRVVCASFGAPVAIILSAVCRRLHADHARSAHRSRGQWATFDVLAWRCDGPAPAIPAAIAFDVVAILPIMPA